MRWILWVGMCVLGCRARGVEPARVATEAPGDASIGSPAPNVSGNVTLSVGTDATAPGRSAPPPVESACNIDADCAVAAFEVKGDHVCCSSCVTTPGTKGWYAKLQRFCGVHSQANCGSLACPMGPTRAVCQNHVCAATADGGDGRPIFVFSERRCVRALRCDAWAGCAVLTGNLQNGYFVHEHGRVARGEGATLTQVCAKDAGCVDAARLSDPTCAPSTARSVVGPPAYSCRLEAASHEHLLGHCREVPELSNFRQAP